MEHIIPLEVWVVLVAAPCVIAWFLGDLCGAARTHRLIEAGDLNDMPEPLIPHHQEARTRARSDTNSSDKLAIEDQAAPVSAQQSANSIESQQRREAFAGMQSLADLHEHAQRIREADKIWDDPALREDMCSTDPISARVLQHYRGSINELGRRNALSDLPAIPVR